VLCLTNKGVQVFVREDEKGKFKEKEYLRSFTYLWFFVSALFVVAAIGVFMEWGTDHITFFWLINIVISTGYGYIRKSKRFRKDPTAVDVQKEPTDKELDMMGYGMISFELWLPFILLLFAFRRP